MTIDAGRSSPATSLALGTALVRERTLFTMRRGRRWAGILALSLLLGGLLAAGSSKTTNTTDKPETIGVVASSEVSGRTETFTLTDGRIVTEQIDNLLPLRTPAVGDLLLAGSSPKPWIFGAYPAPGLNGGKTCYSLSADAARVGGWMEMSNGLRLQVAPDFDPGLYKGDTFHPAKGFCLDERGRVTQVY